MSKAEDFGRTHTAYVSRLEEVEEETPFLYPIELISHCSCAIPILQAMTYHSFLYRLLVQNGKSFGTHIAKVSSFYLSA